MILLQRQKIANLSTGNKIYNNLVPSYLKKKPCTISQVYQKFRIKFQSTQSEKLYHSKIQTRNIQNIVRFLLDQQMEQLKLNHKKGTKTGFFRRFIMGNVEIFSPFWSLEIPRTVCKVNVIMQVNSYQIHVHCRLLYFQPCISQTRRFKEEILEIFILFKRTSFET